MPPPAPPQLLSVRDLMAKLQQDPELFKPNCGLVIVDFLVRHGFITADDEPGYYEISRRTHRDLSGVVAMPVRQFAKPGDRST